jgi:hypothetical protein
MVFDDGGVCCFIEYMTEDTVDTVFQDISLAFFFFSVYNGYNLFQGRQGGETWGV